MHKISYEFKLIATIVSGLVFLIAVTYLSVTYWRRKTEKVSNAASFERDNLMKMSYWELHKATDGFSSENAIGSGSFGSVYKGKLNRKMDKLIAVKVLNLENNSASKSFVAECKILRNVRHRNLVKILTYCSSIDSSRNDFKALVYEFMPNGNLDMWLHPDEKNSSRNLSLLQRINVAIDVASALQYLHNHCENPIVHCDLKPSNILLNGDMCACVGDFGLARFHPKITSEISEMSSIGLRGSIGYAAPEYGTGSEVSACGDIYSFGIILLEMMTGRKPTDDIFKDGLNLHKYAEKALPGHVNQIVDPLIYREEQVATAEEEELGENNVEIVEIEEHGRNIGNSSIETNLQTCIMSILTIALACSQESPTQRMDINDVNKELYRVKGALLGRGKNSL